MSGTALPRRESPKNGWMRVLGVDPAAVGPTGFGIIESDGRRYRVLCYGTLKANVERREASAGAALQDTHTSLCRLMDEFSPHAIAVENVFAALNMRTALKLAEVRGVVLLAAAQHGLEVHSYAPREVKANVAGHGHADKRQVQLMVQAVLSMAVTPEPADAADALAVALCHLQVEQARRRFGLADERDGVLKPRVLAIAANARHTAANSPAGDATRTRPSRIVSPR